MRRRLWVPLLAMSVLGGSGCLSDQYRYDRMFRGKMAPDFELTSLDGTTVRLSDMRGKPVLLSFWGHF